MRYLNFFFAGVIGPGVNFAWAAVGRSFASWKADLVPFGPVRFGTFFFVFFSFFFFSLRYIDKQL